MFGFEKHSINRQLSQSSDVFYFKNVMVNQENNQKMNGQCK